MNARKPCTGPSAPHFRILPMPRLALMGMVIMLGIFGVFGSGWSQSPEATIQAAPSAPDTPIRTSLPGPAARLDIAAEADTDTPVVARFTMLHESLSSLSTGAFTSVNIERIEGPAHAKPQVQTGYPESTIIFPEAGTYTMRFQLHRISKGSCGGVNAAPLLEEERTITVR